MEEQTLATELLHELKVSAKRWFYAFLIMVILEICTVGGFIYYLSLPVDEVVIENDDGNANYIGNDLTGAIYNGKNHSEKTQSTAP